MVILGFWVSAVSPSTAVNRFSACLATHLHRYVPFKESLSLTRLADAEHASAVKTGGRVIWVFGFRRGHRKPLLARFSHVCQPTPTVTCRSRHLCRKRGPSTADGHRGFVSTRSGHVVCRTTFGERERRATALGANALVRGRWNQCVGGSHWSAWVLVL